MYQVGMGVSQATAVKGPDFIQALMSSPVANVLPGIDTFWEELHAPIQELAQRLDWHWLGRLDEPDNQRDFEQVKVALASAVECVMDRVDLDEVAVHLFFICDWETDELRYCEGTFADLLSYFRLFRDWDEPVMKLSKNYVRAGEWSPLLVRLTGLR